MIGKQINFFLTTEDRLHLLKSIKAQAGLVLLQRSDAQPYRVFDIVDRTEDIWAIAYLCPPAQERDVLESVSSERADSAGLAAIEFIQPAATECTISRGRFWYAPKRLQDGKFVQKPKEFVDWANAVFSCVKRELVPFGNGDWIGSEAKTRVAAGDIRLST